MNRAGKEDFQSFRPQYMSNDVFHQRSGKSPGKDVETKEDIADPDKSAGTMELQEEAAQPSFVKSPHIYVLFCVRYET